LPPFYGGVDWNLRDAVFRDLLALEAAVNTGKALFAQLIEFLPWTSLSCSVARYGGDFRVRATVVPTNFAPWPSRS
jgi:hypothetical protein